jgi:hypothetical protein
MRTIHRIYTENKNERQIIRLASASFESFTVQPTSGYYRGKLERSVVVEIIGAQQDAVPFRFLIGGAVVSAFCHHLCTLSSWRKNPWMRLRVLRTQSYPPNALGPFRLFPPKSG